MENAFEERRLLGALRAGDEAAFALLHERYDKRLLALAISHGCTRAVAQEVVQETWAAVARGIHSFEGRAALKTWIFRILVNAANAHAKRERRSVPLSAADERIVDLDELRSRRTAAPPEDHLLWKEMLGEVHAAIEQLSPTQREVITLRDVQGLTAREVCGELGISEGNQRVLLHRARTNVRHRLAGYIEPDERLAA
jgi:RNA polymerase sigma-70 factor, ECF subfamily